MIILKATQETLINAVQSVSGIVEKRHTMAILCNVLIERRQGILHFVASDLEIEITTQLPQEMLAHSFVSFQGGEKNKKTSFCLFHEPQYRAEKSIPSMSTIYSDAKRKTPVVPL